MQKILYILCSLTLVLLLAHCGGGVQHPVGHKRIERLTLDEAFKVYHYYKYDYPRTEQLSKVLERIISLLNDHDIMQPLILELADILFQSENYVKAEEYYGMYAVLYPGSKEIDYINMRTIQSTYRQLSDARKDQSKTKKTIKQAEDYIQTFSQSNRYYKEIVAILQTCYMLLIESELYQIDFYVDRYHYLLQPKSLQAAWNRLTDLAQTSLTHIIDSEIDNLRQLILTYTDPENTKPQDAATAEKYLASLWQAIERIKKQYEPTVRQSMLQRF